MLVERVFHHKVSLAELCGVVVFMLLCFYLLWVKSILLAVLIAFVVIGMTERMLHTTYSLCKLPQVSGQDMAGCLVIDKGRFAKKRIVNMEDIADITIVKRFFGLSHYLLIALKDGRLIGLQPQNEELFLSEWVRFKAISHERS